MTQLWQMETDEVTSLDTETLIVNEEFGYVTFVEWVDQEEGIFLADVDGYRYPQEINLEDCETEDR